MKTDNISDVKSKSRPRRLVVREISRCGKFGQYSAYQVWTMISTEGLLTLDTTDRHLSSRLTPSWNCWHRRRMLYCAILLIFLLLAR